MNEIRILGIHVIDRIKEAGMTQAVLTKHAGIIKTRLGFHEVSEEVCSRNGLIVLELKGSSEHWAALEHELEDIGGIRVKQMNFSI
ncbi:MAG: hypothetical protein PF448_09835 [Bacteroidales bacterium]|jgi:hypothetical protein|nr:hypothetical protein [Bacteroidales bacterium]